jgi:hypothetical protein
MAVDIFHEAGRWVARCGHCGGVLTGHQDQEKLEQALRALGVPELDSVDNEQAIAGAERALFRDGIL